jgi:opacity protein-like surface antigen
MQKHILVGAMSFLVALSLPSAVDAQVRLGLGAGPSFPLSELGEVTNTGFHLQGSLGLQVPLLPVGARADVMWHRFPSDLGSAINSYGGLLNGTLRLPMPIVRPYLIAGVGLMHQADEPHDGHIDEGDGGTEFAFGIGAGAQLRLIAFGAFIEARYLDWGQGGSAVPVTIGISF